MTDKQPEPLRLADLLDKKWWRCKDDPPDELKAAAELRRLHDENRRLVNTLNRVSEVRSLLVEQRDELLAALRWTLTMDATDDNHEGWDRVHAAIAKTEGVKMTNTITLPHSVVEQALEALESGINYDYHGNPYSENDAARCTAYDALRAALDQPQVEQEPAIYPEEAYDLGLEAIPYYTHPQPKRKPLTDEQIAKAVRHLYQSDVAAGMGLSGDIDTARAIERAHGIRGEA